MTDAIATPRLSFLPLLLGGLVTTGLALAGVYALTTVADGIYLMGLYVAYVIPVGALIVGLVAASGYGIAGAFWGYRVSGATLWAVALVQFVAYLAAQYVAYRQLNTGLPFTTYFDVATRSIAFENDHGGFRPPIGAWGYGVRLLEAIGFVGGSVLVPMLLQGRPSCASCGHYMRTKTLSLLPASVPDRPVEQGDVEGRAALEAEQQAAFRAGMSTQEALLQAAAEPVTTPEVVQALQRLRTEHPDADALPLRVAISLARCPRCASGHLTSTLTPGQGNQTRQRVISTVPVAPELVRQLV